MRPSSAIQLAILAVLLGTSPARAVTFGAAPASLVVERTQTNADVRLSSLDARRVIFDVTVRRGEAGNEVVPATEIAVVPPVFAIDPYGVVEIRIAFRHPASGEEHVRIVATEVLSLAEQRDGRVARIVVIPVTRR